MESVTFFTREVDRKRNLFLAIIEHDLRNPLMAITAGVQGLSRLGLEGRGADLLRRLTRGGARIKHLLDDLLDYHRAALGHPSRSLRVAWTSPTFVNWKLRAYKVFIVTG